MAQKLLTKIAFAELAGVNPSTVTRASKSSIKAAMVGPRVDAAHPAALEYIESRKRKTAPSAATGLDPLYETAVEECRAAGRFSVTYIRKAVRVGHDRAVRLRDLMEINGVQDLPGPEPQPAPEPKPRGHAAVREAKKREPPPTDEVFEVPPDIEAFADMTLRSLIERFGTDLRFVDWLKATKAIEEIQEKRLRNAERAGDLVSREIVKTGVIDPFNAAHLRLMSDGAKTIAADAAAKAKSGATLQEVEIAVLDTIESFLRPIKAKVARNLRNA